MEILKPVMALCEVGHTALAPAKCADVAWVTYSSALVPGTQRSASSAVRCRAGAQSLAVLCGFPGPGSAQQRWCVAARPGHASAQDGPEKARSSSVTSASLRQES